MKLEQGQTYGENHCIICLGYNEEKLNTGLMTLYNYYKKACLNWEKEFFPLSLATKEDLERIVHLNSSSAIEGISLEDFEKSYSELRDNHRVFSITQEKLKKGKEKVDIKLWLTKSALISSVPVYLNTYEYNKRIKVFLKELYALKGEIDYHSMFWHFYEKVKTFDVFSLYYNTQTHWYYFYSELYKGFIPLYYVKNNRDVYYVLKARVHCEHNEKLVGKAYDKNMDRIMTKSDENFKYMQQCVNKSRKDK